MLKVEEVMELQILRKQGKSLKAIARETGYSINTIRKYTRDNKLPKYKNRPQKPQKLDNYKNYIKSRIAQADPIWLPATVIFREIKELGYEGSISLLRAYMFNLKPKAKEQIIVRFETAPGEQMQVDFANFNFLGFKFYAFVALLCYSRMLYIEFVRDQQIETVLSSHERTFDYFGGIPRSILYDNMKTVVIQRNAYGKGHHKLNQKFFDFAKHYNFIPKLCKPYNPQTKGKVERAISYLRNNFYNPYVTQNKIIELDILNYAVLNWLEEVANKRTHATTQSIPLERWVAEKKYLQTIPSEHQRVIPCKNLNPATIHTKNIMQQNEAPLQHNLEIYQSLLSGGVA